MLLDISRTTDVAAAPASAWALYRDLPRLVTLLPAVSDFRPLEPDKKYAANVSEKLGPFKLSVPVEIELQTVEEPKRIVAALTGADSRGQARVKGTLEGTIEPLGDDRVRLTMSMQLEVLGKLATLGAMPMRRRADEIFTDFVRRIDAELTGPGAAS
ncbi:MAG: SRPBCC family protein [Chloroflexi bacterium]|nr:SRPBCC family protein [Chloroflexota bacterium]